MDSFGGRMDCGRGGADAMRIIPPEECNRVYSYLGLDRAFRRCGVGCGVSASNAAPAAPTWEAQILALNPLFFYDSDTGTVGSWTDLSADPHHAVQATAAKRPTIAAAQFGTHRGYVFDGSDDFLQASFTLAAQPLEYILVATLGVMSGGTSKYYVDGKTDDSALMYYDSGGGMWMHSGGFLNPHLTPPAAGVHIFNCQFNEASSIFIIDGGTPGTGTSPTANIAGITIGAGGAGGYAGPMVAGCLIGWGSILSPTNRALVETLAKARYGTP